MKPDRRDLELLRLAGRYRWLPLDAFSRFGFERIGEDIAVLVKLGMLSIARNKLYIQLTPKGVRILAEMGFDSDVAAKRPYENSVTLRRRLEAASVMLTALRAGIDTLPDGVDALRSQPVFLPLSAFRSATTNPASNSTCAGFGHWGGKAFMLHFVSPASNGMYLATELKTFHNLASVFSQSIDEPEALVFAGTSYRQVYGQLTSQAPPKKKGAKGFRDFAHVYGSADVTIHLLSCDETGAMQLALMRQPDYNARIARAAYGERWEPHDRQIPDADGAIDGGRTLLIAADMDIHRAERVIENARKRGRKGVALIAFKEQMEGLLMGLFPHDGFVLFLKINREVLDAAFGEDFSLDPFGGGPDRGGRHG